MSARLKSTDGKGRVTLGPAFANMPVQVEERGEGEWVIRLVETIPAKEAWLFKNKEALNLVTSAILGAQKREFVADPRDGQDYSWLEELDNEDVQDEVESRGG